MNAGAQLKPKILCVDDEPRVLAGLKLTLRHEFDVLVESTPTAALALLDRTPAVVAVISDMRMPAMDGVTFLAQVARRHPQAARILLTGETGTNMDATLAGSGLFSILAKPCAPAQLIATLHELVQRQPRGAR